MKTWGNSSLRYCISAFVLLVFGYAAEALSGAGVWSSTGPEGGTITSLAIDPRNTDRVYAGVCGGRIFRSDKRGAAWSFVGDYGRPCPYALVVDPKTPSVLYLSAPDFLEGGVFKSVDSGATWSLVRGAIPSRVTRALAMDPSAPDTLYAGTEAGVFKTRDGGATWEFASAALAASAVTALAVDPLLTDRVYAANKDGVFKTEDGGGSWQPTGSTSGSVQRIVVNPGKTSIVYLATSDAGVVRSLDGGITWNKILFETPSFFSLAIDPSNPATLYAADGSYGSRIYRSDDWGDRWTEIGRGLSGDLFVYALAVHPTDSRTVLAATSGLGVFVSQDRGDSFAASNSGLVATDIVALAVDASTSVATLHAGAGSANPPLQNGSLFRSTDEGATWAGSNNGIPRYDSIFTLAVDPFDPSVVYAGRSYDLVKSKDGGANWQSLLQAGGPMAFRGMAVDPVTPGILYYGFGNAIRKTADGGATWQTRQLPAGAVVSGIAIDPAAPNVLYASTRNQGVFKSMDAGDTWTAANNGFTRPGVNGVAVNTHTPDVLYAATDDGLFRSTDAAASWTVLPGAVPAGENARAVAVDPVVPANVYVGSSFGVSKSIDGGATWAALDDGLTFTAINALVVNPIKPNVIYAGTIRGGVYVLEQAAPGTTDPGTGVVVQPVDSNPNPPTNNPTPVVLTFSNVTSAGTTSVTTSTAGAPPPSGLKLGNPPVYFEISTTAGFSGSIRVCINYTGIAFGNENTLRLQHNVNGQWVDITTSLDTARDIICGETTSLSPFAVFERSPYPFTGFFAPAVNPPDMASVNAGSVLAVKFSLSGYRGLDIVRPLVSVISCDGELPTQALLQALAAGKDRLRYDATSDQYVYPWKTEASWKGTCREFQLGLDDGSSHAIRVRFR